MITVGGIFEFVVNLVEAYFMYIFLRIYFKSRSMDNIKLIFLLVAQASIMWGINIVFGVGSLLGFILLFTSYILLYRFIFNSSLSKLILGALIFYVFVSIFEFIGIVISTTIFNITPDIIAEPNGYRIITAVIVRIMLYVFIRYIHKIKISPTNIKKVYVYELIIILVFNVLFIFVVVNIYIQGEIIQENRNRVIILTLLMIIFSFIIIKITEQIMKYGKKETEWVMREKEYKRQIEYIKSMESLTYTLRAQRHDFNHYIGCIYGLLETNKIQELKAYTKKLISSAEYINSIVNIDNPVIAAVLNFKLSIAEEKKIKIETHIDIPKEMNIDSTDICIVLGNALDNAIEACENIENKMISVDMYMEREHFVLKISNTKKFCSSDEESLYKTSKADKENHGFGIENIKYVVNKYDGLLKIDDKINMFAINIALKNDSL